MEPTEGGGRHRLIDAPPPNLVSELSMPHDELVLGRAAGVGASFDDERTGIGQSRFPTPNGVLYEYARRKVTVIRARRSPRLSRHRSANRVRSTVGFLDFQSHGSSARAHAADPPHDARGHAAHHATQRRRQE